MAYRVCAAGWLLFVISFCFLRFVEGWYAVVEGLYGGGGGRRGKKKGVAVGCTVEMQWDDGRGRSALVIPSQMQRSLGIR